MIHNPSLWNFDVSPETIPMDGTYILVTTRRNEVVRSRYHIKHKRWSMLHSGEWPVAWMPWPEGALT